MVASKPFNALKFTRAALITRGCAKSKFLGAAFNLGHARR
jgi:hypothetical protein